MDTQDQAVRDRPLRLLFLHHSIGEHLLADEGPESREAGTHPCGGGLRRLLEAQGYQVNEATYGSKLGQHTDLFDWLPKFRDHMPALLRLAHQDRELPGGERNDIVLFKSCFPNNQFMGAGSEPGNPAGPELTEANARATLRALLPLFAAQPETLFVFMTTPPISPVVWPESGLKSGLKRLLGKPTNREKFAAMNESARRFARWVASPEGWLAGYGRTNVAVFDYYDLLTDQGASNCLRYPTGAHGEDSHPSARGQQKAAAELVPFLGRAVRRAGLVNATPHLQTM
jgi:hypothetical protein